LEIDPDATGDDTNSYTGALIVVALGSFITA